MASNDKIYFPNVALLLEEVRNDYDNNEHRSMKDALNVYIRKRKYWPMIQTKKFFGNNNLVLLHNTYKRDDVQHFQQLYDEVRSVVLDFDAPTGENIVVSLADKIPDRMSLEQYNIIKSEEDVCEECYEGTMIYVYYHVDKWYFSTSTCPNINSSKYFHPTKTHGTMFDETLEVLFPDTEKEKLREKFVSYLNIENSYGFLLVHYENKHVMNYSDTFGENYKRLYHIFTRNKKTSEPVTDKIYDMNMYYSKQYNTVEEGITSLETNNQYGMIIRRNNKVYKVSKNEIIQTEKENLGNSNPWVNMLHVYMQQNPQYKINDYIKKYLTEPIVMYDSNGKEMVPVYIIHSVMMTLKDILYSAYSNSTYYDLFAHQYTIDKTVDSNYSSIIRFHLSQLRQLQITKHKYGYITPQVVYHYLCLHQTMKNIRMLIDHVATSEYEMPFKTAECFRVLNNALHNNDMC